MKTLLITTITIMSLSRVVYGETSLEYTQQREYNRQMEAQQRQQQEMLDLQRQQTEYQKQQLEIQQRQNQPYNPYDINQKPFGWQ